MTSEQRIAEQAIAFAKGFADALSIPLRPDALSLLEQSTGDLIAAVRAEAIEEAAKVCDMNAWAAHPDRAEAAAWKRAAHSVRALAKERKG